MASEKSDAEALEFYNKSPEIKAEALRSFNSMDRNGNGSITKKEFSRFLEKHKFLSKWIEHDNMFGELDKDGSGELDFVEFLTFFYKVSTWFTCDGCGQEFEFDKRMPRLTCVKCFRKQCRAFDLCNCCHLEKKYEHKHKEFQELSSLIRDFAEEMEKLRIRAAAIAVGSASATTAVLLCTIM